MDTNRNLTDDKKGEELKEQRFQMLEDIAKELSDKDLVFPTYFDLTLQLRKELQNPDLPIAAIAKIVSVEPLVAAKLIKLANSAFYNRAGVMVWSLPEAIARLGMKVVRNTAQAVAMKQIMLSKELAAYSQLTNALWRHSVKTAVAARILAKTYTKLNSDEAMLAGLVHDFGAFYMLYRANQYPELRERGDTMKYLILRWHDSVGASVLKALGLPEEIVKSSVDHDLPRQPVPTTVKTLSDIVYVSNVLAGANFDWLLQEMDPDATGIEVLRMTFAEILPDIESETSEMLAIFD